MSRSDEFQRARGLYGAENGLERLFPDEAPSTQAPWPNASQLVHRFPYEKELVRKELTGPVHLRDIDPVELHKTQPGITRGGTRYYMSGEYERSGSTYADQGNAGNRYPVVYEREGRDGRPPQRLILSGHHRAAAALLQGRQFRARVIEGGWGEAR